MTEYHALKIGDQVLLHYRLSCRGEEIANTFTVQPETFRIGQGDIDVRLESLLIGMRVGDHRTFHLESGAAFGSPDPGMVHDLPRSEFAALETANTLAPGHDVEFTLPNGQTLNGVIRSIDADFVRVDFNHPLAGLPVTFEVKIIEVNGD